jgi:hypothetical protein
VQTGWPDTLNIPGHWFGYHAGKCNTVFAGGIQACGHDTVFAAGIQAGECNTILTCGIQVGDRRTNN